MNILPLYYKNILHFSKFTNLIFIKDLPLTRHAKPQGLNAHKHIDGGMVGVSLVELSVENTNCGRTEVTRTAEECAERGRRPAD